MYRVAIGSLSYNVTLFFEMADWGGKRMGCDRRAWSAAWGHAAYNTRTGARRAPPQIGGGRVCAKRQKLQNEANFPECLTVWIALVDNVLAIMVRRFVTWLRFAGIGFVLEYGHWVGAGYDLFSDPGRPLRQAQGKLTNGMPPRGGTRPTTPAPASA